MPFPDPNPRYNPRGGYESQWPSLGADSRGGAGFYQGERGFAAESREDFPTLGAVGPPAGGQQLPLAAAAAQAAQAQWAAAQAYRGGGPQMAGAVPYGAQQWGAQQALWAQQQPHPGGGYPGGGYPGGSYYGGGYGGGAQGPPYPPHNNNR